MRTATKIVEKLLSESPARTQVIASSEDWRKGDADNKIEQLANKLGGYRYSFGPSNSKRGALVAVFEFPLGNYATKFESAVQRSYPDFEIL